MDDEWQKTFQERMRHFEERCPSRKNNVAVSIKIRVTLGCFHREHSPNAYRLIDRHLRNSTLSSGELVLEEHESGPELLVYLAVATASITLAKSVIDLITTIIKARAEGIKAGDTRTAPLELIVRRVDSAGEFREAVVLSVGHTDAIDEKAVEKRLNEALSRLVEKKEAEEG
jgi:hypothetical protein